MQLPSPLYQISDNSLPNRFGTFLKLLRTRQNIPQKGITALLPETIDQKRYSSFERNTRSPRFEELPSIWQALHRAKLQLTLQDRHLFIELAQYDLASQWTQNRQREASDWEQLRKQLASIDKLPDLAPIREWRTPSTASVPTSSRMEISHLIGREQWLQSLTQYIAERQAKWIVLQGPPGVGKTSELHRVGTSFQQHIPRYYVIYCKLPALEQEIINAEVALEVLLSEIVEGIGLNNAPMPTRTIQARIKYTIDCLARADRPTLILLDNAEQVLGEDQSDLARIWKQFYERFVQSRHATTLVFASQQWPVQFTRESQWIVQMVVPALTDDEGIELLCRLGLGDLSKEQLGQAVAAVGGIPACLEWLNKLIQEPTLHSDWSALEEEDGEISLSPTQVKIARLTRLLEDADLFGGPVATRIHPLLTRVTKQLSPEAQKGLQDLALSPLPLGAPALKFLYEKPAPIQELRNASLLAAYQKRVMLLPMVVASIKQQLSSIQVQDTEKRLVEALHYWLEAGVGNAQEKGLIFTELACLLLRHHHLLAAAELVLHHAWLSSQTGHIFRLAHCMQQELADRSWENDMQQETEQERECGAILLHYYLASYLGERIDGQKRAEDYAKIYTLIKVGLVKVEPLMEVHIIDHIMINYVNKGRFEEAQHLLEECWERLEPLLADSAELHATLLSKRAALCNRWSGAKRLDTPGEAKQFQEQAIAIYKQCLYLLEQAEQNIAVGSLRYDTIKKKQATFLNNLSYQLNMLGYFEEALQIIHRCLALKEAGFADRDSLAASYGEKALIHAALGQFSQAIHFDTLARETIKQCADAGDTMSQEEMWIYQVNQARILSLLGRVDEAECRLLEAEPYIHERRSVFKVLAKETLIDIHRGRQESAPYPFQLDWRWIKRYRELSAYDAYWWLAHAGPFDDEELQLWNQLFPSRREETVKNELRALMIRSRDRELTAAFALGREPSFCYPAIDIEEVKRRISGLLQLDAEIAQGEPNAIVRKLYHDAIEDEITFLRMIEATYNGENEQFRALTQQLFPLPTEEEMLYTLTHVSEIVAHGLWRDDTAEVSRQVIAVLKDLFGITLVLPSISEANPRRQSSQKVSSLPPQEVSARAAKRFFEAILRENGYEEWEVVLDPNAGGPRVESGLRQLILQDQPTSVEEIREYVSHEFLGHVARSVAGERSLLGLLGIGTKNYMVTEEGLADYHERHVAALHGQAFDDSGAWLGTLSVGLASGVVTSPQTFSTLFSFFEQFLLLYRLLWRNDEDRATAEQRARRNALIRCLRTYRGVPDLTMPDVCFSKDVVYLRGYLEIEQAVAKDETVLDRLAVGKVAYELLPDLEELGIIAANQSLRKIAYDPDLDKYILSFEEGTDASQKVDTA